LSWWAPVTAWLLFLLHASIYGNWLIDDAGISLAYAANLAGGHGLVSQPGMPPVEGYSNPTWTIGLALINLLFGSNPLWTLKLASILLVLVSFLVIHRVISRMPWPSVNGPAFTFVVLACCSVNPSFVIWTTSGLENPLFVTLILVLLGLSINLVQSGVPIRQAGVAGLVAGLVALTRPDGVIYALIYPFALLLFRVDRQPWRFRHLASYIALFVAVVATYVSFRLAYFGEWLPNTYYAKPGSSIARVLGEGVSGNLLALSDLLAKSAFPQGHGLAIVVLLSYPILLVARSSINGGRPILIVFLFLLAGFLAYRILPPDWMGEYRFASPLFPLLYVFVFAMIGLLTSDWIDARTLLGRTLPTSIGIVFLAASAVEFNERAEQFSASPTVPLETIAKTNAQRFNRYADALGLSDASLAVPDVGGALMYSRLRIVDMAGLCDRRVGRLISRDKSSDLRDYLLGEARPTFIQIHGFWAGEFNLYADPRFADQYVAISEELHSDGQGISNIKSGSYVRRDVLKSDTEGWVRQLRRLPEETPGASFPTSTRS
jgi:hypothetical protein